jgi:putative flippase GtrA
VTDLRLLRDRRVRYVAAGALSAGTYYGLFSLGWLALAGRLPYPGLVVLVNIATAMVTYPLYRQRVFGASGPFLSGFFRFYVTSLGGLAYFLLGLPLLVEVARVPVLPAQAAMLVALPLINYQVLRRWVFAARSKTLAPRGNGRTGAT